MTFQERIDRILPRVSKPTRYVGREWNSIHKDRESVAITFALAFPDAYEVAMSHLGTKILYHEINRRDDSAAERVFAPWVDMEAEMRRDGIELFSLESWTPVRRFDILGFTLQYELTYTNILNMLDLAEIPLRSADRTTDDPLVIAGGPCAFNPEPLAAFLDAVVLGDGEEVVHEIIDAVKTWKASGSARRREDLLRSLAGVQGVYVPSLYDVDYHPNGAVRKVTPSQPGVPGFVRRRVVADLDSLDYPTDPIVPYMEVVHDRVMVEVFRGCTRGCRFCHAGIVYRPVRERSPEKVLELADKLIRSTGHNEISLVSLSTADYSGVGETLPELVRRHAEKGVGLSLPSLRVDAFSVGLAEEVQKVRKTGLTFAPEAGTQRLRNVINKGVTEEDLREACRAAFKAGWSAVKLYFMIGLPTETDEDLKGIADLAYGVLRAYEEAVGKAEARKARLTVSVSNFVPKAHTPFQWEPQPEIDELRRRQKVLKDLIRDRRIEYNYHEAPVSFIEAVFSRGDRRLAKALEEAWRLGCRFDGWTEHFRFDFWLKALAETGTDTAFYAHRHRDHRELFPWEHLESGVTKEFLIEENERALSGQLMKDCRWDGCYDCGVCPSFGVAIDLKAGPRRDAFGPK